MLLNRIETRLIFLYFGLLIPSGITRVQSQIVSIFFEQKKKSVHGFLDQSVL